MTPHAPRIRSPYSPLSGRIELDDFDAQRAVIPAWDERFAQIGRGRARVRLAVATTGRMQLAYASRSPGCRVEGAPVPGTSILAIAVSGPFFHLQGRPWGSDRFAYVRSGVEYVAMGSAPHRVLAISVQNDLLDRASLVHWGHVLPVDRSGPVLLAKHPGGPRGVARTWARWLAAAFADPGLLRDPAIAAQMEEEVLGSILDASVIGNGPEPVRPWRELALRADAYLRETLAEAPHLDEVCRAVRASPRSLHASFKSVFNTTPKAYQTALRLDGARHDLLRAPPGATVSSIAVKWSFFQFGRFAGDYRRMFGEGPRQTLGRARDARAICVHLRSAGPS